MATLQLSVQRIGNYSYLALDNLAVTGLAAPATSPAGQRKAPRPPLDEQMLGQPPTSLPGLRAASAGQQSTVVPGRGWGGYFISIGAFMNSLAAQMPAAGAVTVTIEAPSVDETDVEWFATGPAVALTDPWIFNPAITGTSRYGRQFAPGDYVLIADFSTFVDAGGVTRYNVEIAQLAAISLGGRWTLNRAGPTSPAGQARFGTPLRAHAAGLNIYRLIDAFWNIALPSPATPQLKKLPWDNMCVAAVLATAAGVAPLLLNLIPPASQPAVPGFRTLNGAEYTLGDPGAIALGGTSVLRLSVAGWHSFRNIFFECDGAAPVTGPTNITLAYIQPDRKKAYQVATFVIPSASRVSFPIVNGTLQMPQNRRFPFTGTWPPHANLPLMVNGLNAAGKLINGFTLDPTKPATMQEDGELDYIVTLNAGTAGVGLRGTVQT